MSKPLPMPLTQAVALATCLVEYELECPQIVPPPPDWELDLAAARETLREFLSELNPPPKPPKLTPQQARAETQRSNRRSPRHYIKRT